MTFSVIEIFSGESQDELLHHLQFVPRHHLHGDALPQQELAQDSHLQIKDDHTATKLHGSTWHCQGLHRNYYW